MMNNPMNKHESYTDEQKSATICKTGVTEKEWNTNFKKHNLQGSQSDTPLTKHNHAMVGGYYKYQEVDTLVESLQHSLNDAWVWIKTLEKRIGPIDP